MKTIHPRLRVILTRVLLWGEIVKRAIAAIAVGFIFLTVALMPTSVGAPATGTGSSSGLSANEVKVLKGLNYNSAWNDLILISGMGEKVAGTDAELNAQNYIYSRLSSMAMDKVVMEKFPVSAWQHFGTTIKIVSNGNEDVQATTYGDSYSIWGYQDHIKYTFGNKNGGKTLVASVVDCGLGTDADFNAIGNLAGAIALIHRNDDVQGWPNPPVEEAALHGASATVFYGYYTGNDLPAGIKQDSVGGSIPILSISPISAWHILDLLKAGNVELKIDGRVDILSEKYAESTNVAAYMYGKTRPNEYVVISGHIDCWWNGASDDSSSIAAMLEFARLFSEARKAGTFVPDRTLVFCSVGAEEQGGPQGTWYNWLVGSYEFVKAHPEIMASLAVELNMDGVSFVKASGRYWAECTWEVNGLVAKAISDLGLGGAVGYYNPIWSWTDAWCFGAKGGGSTIQLQFMAGFDPYYHTQYDDMPMQSHATIDIVLRMHTVLAMRAANALVLPIEFQYTVDWAASYLKTEKKALPTEAANIDLDLAALSNLRAQAVAVNAYASSLNAQYAVSKDPAVWQKANALNRALIDARRIITPWTLGEGGLMGSWDVFLRSEQHAHDLGFVNSAIAALNKGQTGNAVTALSSVYTMEWGKSFSRQIYLQILHDMMDVSWYWGADFDQQQRYVDVQGVYLGLKDGTMLKDVALSQLETTKNTLTQWYEADLQVQAWAWTLGAGILDAASP
jgi:hypothetical protein